MKTFVVAWLLLLSVVPAAAQTREKSPPAPNRAETSAQDMPLGQLRLIGTVRVGQSAPDFTLTSSAGPDRTLSRLKGDWLVLVFAENREDFAALRAVQERLLDGGTRLYGICKEKPQRLRSYVEEQRLPFEILADDTGEISALYGFYDWERRSTTRGFVVVDRRSVVRLALEGQAPPDQVADLARFTITGY
ncbi:MAG: redoxin domain-containing protein [Candidatus Eisenbacteria bacterium]|uniref:Redoxin domain-containing protein n=1 Tax=Eiseniibacteriota bacterium TaxID=2212470 RepID=A0A538U8X8_UNCEI|nr:MAG: redoxin domain-containing protein [Candidatus Eisenbacteria bacterium]